MTEMFVGNSGLTREEINALTKPIADAIELGVRFSLGMQTIEFGQEFDDMPSVVSKASILPFVNGERSDTPTTMDVVIGVAPDDTLTVQVFHWVRGKQWHHAYQEGVYIDQLNRLLLALDYNGKETLNPRLWQ